MNGKQPIWAENFFKIVSKSKMALNLSRGEPKKYYSSNRIASLLGNGLLTFIDKKTHFGDFFSNDEIVLYDNIEDLSEKVKKYAIDDKKRNKMSNEMCKCEEIKSRMTPAVYDYLTTCYQVWSMDIPEDCDWDEGEL